MYVCKQEKESRYVLVEARRWCYILLSLWQILQISDMIDVCDKN